MDSYKKDFENAVEMIDWQNKMLKQQADEIVKLKLEWQYMYDRANMEKTNEPVAWMDEDENVVFEKCKVYPIPLYTHPVKYCPSEDNAAYEKGFIDGMAKMTESAVHCAVEGMAVKELNEQFKKGFEAGKEEGWKAHKFHHPVKELTDEEIIEIGLKLRIATTEIEGNWSPVVLEFARAILRKAQEK